MRCFSGRWFYVITQPCRDLLSDRSAASTSMMSLTKVATRHSITGTVVLVLLFSLQSETDSLRCSPDLPVARMLCRTSPVFQHGSLLAMSWRLNRKYIYALAASGA